MIPSGYEQWPGVETGHSYRFYEENLSFEDGRAKCEEVGASLLSPHTLANYLGAIWTHLDSKATELVLILCSSKRAIELVVIGWT